LQQQRSGGARRPARVNRATGRSAASLGNIDEAPYEIPVPARAKTEDVIIPDEYLPFKMLALTNGITRTTSPVVSKLHDLSMREWRVMLIVAAHPDVTAIEIAEYLNSDKMIITRAAGDLLRRGLLVRRLDRSDRRRWKLRLSRKGRATYRGMAALARVYDEALRTSLTVAEQRAIDTILDKLTARVRAIEFV